MTKRNLQGKSYFKTKWKETYGLNIPVHYVCYNSNAFFLQVQI